MKKFIPFGSIDNITNVCKNLQSWTGFHNYNLSDCSITLEGYVKVHGTNMGISYFKEDDSINFQTKERVITPTCRDTFNMGLYVNSVGIDWLKNNLKSFLNDKPDAVGVIVYGELCGSRIQKRVAVNGMPVSFYAFGLVVVYNDTDNDGNHCWKRERLDVNLMPRYPEKFFYNKNDFKKFSYSKMNIDSFKTVINEVMDITLEVEENCPVGTTLNPENEVKTGEGIVWSGTFECNGHTRYLNLKSKGGKYKRGGRDKTKVKEHNKYNKEQNEAIQNFVDITANNDRLEQGFEYLDQIGKTYEMKNIGDYIQWIIKDIKKEHSNDVADILYPLGLDWNSVGKLLTNIAKDYYIDKLNKSLE